MTFINKPFSLFLKRLSFTLPLFLFFSHNSSALNYYWIGNGGNWSSLSHWATTSGGTTLHTQMPTAADDVFFDANSFTLPGQVVSIQANSFAHHIYWTGALNDPAWNGSFPNTLKIYGSLTLIPNMFMNFSGQVHFLSTTTGQTITTAGKSFTGFQFLGNGGEWTLQDALNCTGISLFAGTLNTNDKTVNGDWFNAGSTVSTITKTLNMGTSVFNMTGNWDVMGTGFIVNCGTSVINMSGDAAQFKGGGTFNDVNFTSTAGGGSITGTQFHDVNFAGKGTITGPCTFNNVTFQGDGIIGIFTYLTTFNDLTFTAGKSYQVGSIKVNGNFNASGSSCSLLTKLRQVGNANAGYINFANPVHLSYVDMRAIVASGPGPFTVTHSSPFTCYSFNTNWTCVEIPVNMYWIGNGGNWSDPNHWSYSSGGSPAGCPPLHDNDVFFDANSFSLPGQTVLVDSPNVFCRSMDWTGVTNTPTLSLPGTKSLLIHGSTTFATGMDIDSHGMMYMDALTTGNRVTTHGQVLGRVMFRGWNLGGGEWTLQDTFNSDSIIFQTGGILNTNNQTVNAVQFFILGLYTPRTLNMGSSVFNLSGRYPWINHNYPATHINSGTSTINLTNDTARFDNDVFVSNTVYTFYDVNFTGNGIGSVVGPSNFHNVVFNGKGVIGQTSYPQPLSFNDVIFRKDGEFAGFYNFHNLDFTAGHTYKFWPGARQIISNRWKLPGTCTENISLQSTVAGSYGDVNATMDSVHGTYLNIRDIHSFGGAVFTAYNSVDQGGNAGWHFSTAPILNPPGSITGTGSVCPGATGVGFHVSPVGGGAITYQWTVPPGANITSGQGDTLIVVDFGTSSSGNIQVQSFDGCNLSTATGSLPVTVLPRLTPAVTLAADPGTFVCPATLVSFTATASGTGSGSINYDFKINGTTVQSSNSPVFTSGIMNGDMISCHISVTGGSCYSSTTAISNDIIMNTGPNAQPVNVNAGAAVTISTGQTIQLNASADAGTYLWSPGTGLSSINILNPLASPLITTQYTLTVTTASGCSSSDNIIIEVKAAIPACEIEPVNAFSPNGDGINDRWIVFHGSCTNYPAVSVYNRYGSLVYQSRYYQNDWQGTYKGKPLPDGTYYAVVTYTLNGRTIVKKTDLSILR